MSDIPATDTHMGDKDTYSGANYGSATDRKSHSSSEVKALPPKEGSTEDQEANFLAETIAKAKAAYRSSKQESKQDNSGPALSPVVGQKRSREEDPTSGTEREQALKKLAMEMRQQRPAGRIAVNPAFLHGHPPPNGSGQGPISHSHSPTPMPYPIPEGPPGPSGPPPRAPERIFAENYPVEYAYVGLIIGKHGDNLKRIEKESGTRMKFAPDPGPGSIERTVTITGSETEVSRAKGIIVDMIAAAKAGLGETPQAWSNNPNHVTITVFIPNQRVGLVIGKGGETIKDLQNKSNCRISITPDSAADRKAEHRRVNLIGDESSVQYGRTLIEEIVAPPRDAAATARGQQRPAEYTETFMVPKESLGVIIGKSGETIKALQAQSMCGIQVQQHPEPGTDDRERTITITGSAEWLPFARKLIQEKVAVAMEKHASKRQDKRSGGSGWYWKDSKEVIDSMPIHQNPTPAYNPAEPALARRDDRYQYDSYHYSHSPPAPYSEAYSAYRGPPPQAQPPPPPPPPSASQIHSSQYASAPLAPYSSYYSMPSNSAPTPAYDYPEYGARYEKEYRGGGGYEYDRGYNATGRDDGRGGAPEYHGGPHGGPPPARPPPVYESRRRY